jgi:hypothetical protein
VQQVQQGLKVKLDHQVVGLRVQRVQQDLRVHLDQQAVLKVKQVPLA